MDLEVHVAHAAARAAGIAGAAFFFGSSATIASVVIRRPATDEAPCSA